LKREKKGKCPIGKAIFRAPRRHQPYLIETKLSFGVFEKRENRVYIKQ